MHVASSFGFEQWKAEERTPPNGLTARENPCGLFAMVFRAVLAFQLTCLLSDATFSRGLTVPALPSLPREPEVADR